MVNMKDIPRIDKAHMEIHEGESYHAFNDESTMASGETINFAFKTPAATTTHIHMFVSVTCRVAGLLEILEAATWTAQSGTKFVPINRNRNSSNTSAILGNETTTVFTANEIAFDVTTVLTSNATTLTSTRLFGASNQIHHSDRAVHEFVLKANTTYVIRFTADGASNGAHLLLNWYEEIIDS